MEDTTAWPKRLGRRIGTRGGHVFELTYSFIEGEGGRDRGEGKAKRKEEIRKTFERVPASPSAQRGKWSYGQVSDCASSSWGNGISEKARLSRESQGPDFFQGGIHRSFRRKRGTSGGKRILRHKFSRV